MRGTEYKESFHLRIQGHAQSPDQKVLKQKVDQVLLLVIDHQKSLFKKEEPLQSLKDMMMIIDIHIYLA